MKAVKTTTICNLVSTFAGVPFTWAILLFIQTISGGSVAWGINTIWGKIIAITWQAPWLIPYQFQFNWMIPSAGIVLLIPFFFVSWWIEYLELIRK